MFVGHGPHREPGVEEYPSWQGEHVVEPAAEDVPATHRAGGLEDNGSPVPAKQYLPGGHGFCVGDVEPAVQ